MRIILIILSLFLVSTSLEAKSQSRALQRAVHRQDYRSIGKLYQHKMQRKRDFKKNLKYLRALRVPPVRAAIEATKTILSLDDDIRLRPGQLFQIALFLETDFQKYIHRHEYYLPAAKTRLACAIEYDPVTRYRFIHLEPKKNTLGHGSKKTVTRSILYKGSSSEIVARCMQSKSIQDEYAITKRLQGSRGIIKLYAVTQHMEGGVQYDTMFCKLYRSGTCGKLLKSGCRFTFEEKVQIALQILEGLDTAHSRGVIHRDLGVANYLIDIEKGKKGKRKIDAVIADFGSARFVSTIQGEHSQAHTFYTPPEGIYFKTMHGEDYFASDVFAVGCLLYRLYYGKKGPWQNVNYIKSTTGTRGERYEQFIASLKVHVEGKEKALLHKAPPLSKKEQFEAIILRMLRADPHQRGSAKTLLRDMREILCPGI